MKKKILTILLVLFAISTCFFTLTACGHEHSYVSQVIEPTCTEQGYTKHTCDCGDTYNDNYVNALEHNYTTSYTWNGEQCIAFATCSKDSSHIIMETATGVYVKDTDATCTTAEMGHYEATFVNTAFEKQCTTSNSYVNGEELGHNYSTPTYIWEDNKCTATRVCSRNNSHIETETVTGVYIKDTNATCTTAETGHYEATFVNSAFEKQSTTSNSYVNGEELGHNYATPTYVWEDNKCTATRICGRDNNHIETESVIGIYVKDTDATCTTAETGHFEATFINPAFETQYTITNSYENGEPNEEHNWEYGNCAACGETQLEMQLASNNQYYIVKGKGTFNGEQLNIPTSYKTLPVKSIGSNAFKDYTSLTNIVIPNSVTSIGSSALKGCNSLISITLPFVGANQNATSFMAVFGYIFGYTTSNSEAKIEGAIYQYYDSFHGASVSYSYYHYYIPSTIKSIIISNNSKVAEGAFRNCSSLTSIEMSNSVTSIGNSAFRGCSGLTSVTIPNSVTSIGSHAFSSCRSLTSVTIGDSVTSIGDWAFYGCSNLTKVNYKGTIDVWAQIEFSDYESNPLYYAKNLCINNELITEAILTKATKINDYAFYNCDSLTSVTIGDSVTSIGSYAFSSCSSLTRIAFEDTSTWYRTTNYTNWQNKTGGTSTNVTTPTNNDDYFKSTYNDYYWYKL